MVPPDLAPTDAEADALIRNVERRHPNPTDLDRAIAHWWEL